MIQSENIMNTYVKKPNTTKMDKYAELYIVYIFSFFFASLQGETGRPGMPGEKGNIGAMVGDFRNHPPPTQHRTKHSPHPFRFIMQV